MEKKQIIEAMHIDCMRLILMQKPSCLVPALEVLNMKEVIGMY